MPSASEIDRLLPQTQCEQCGFKGCFKYAEAIAAGEAPINRCPPGGNEGIQKLSQLTGQPIAALDPECGEHVCFETAQIDRSRCIGCRLCINVCPTDCIIGSPKHMHVVDIEFCTGCCLCEMACPMDCIEMVRVPFEWTPEKADIARLRFNEKKRRWAEVEKNREAELEKKSTQAAKKEFLASLLKSKSKK